MTLLEVGLIDQSIQVDLGCLSAFTQGLTDKGSIDGRNIWRDIL